jgi:hypothetical protein
MPPYFFRTGPEEAGRIVASSPEGSARIYEGFDAQDWMRGAMDDTGSKELDTTSLDFLANEVVDATLVGDALMRVDADSREALQELAETAEADIRPFN